MRSRICPRWAEKRQAMMCLGALALLLIATLLAPAQQPVNPAHRIAQPANPTHRTEQPAQQPANPAQQPANPAQQPTAPLAEQPVEAPRTRQLLPAFHPQRRTGGLPADALNVLPRAPAGYDYSPRFRVPMNVAPARDRIQLDSANGLVSLVVREAYLQDVLSALADSQQVNIACATRSNAPVSITLRKVPLDEALTAIVSICGCTWTRCGNIIHVTDLAANSELDPNVQGRQVEVFPLDYVSGEDLSQAIMTLLSPVGTVYVTSAQPDDIRRTQESIVVEDMPQYLQRIAQYIHQMDQPPRQVVIQVHVLQIDLEKGCRHGVNFSHIMNVAGNTFKLQTTGFASAATPQAFFAQLTASNLTGLLEAVKDTTNAKTLASPRVLALNGQLSRIQIGEKLGYRILSNTQTATLESVEFLDVGVVLEVTPTISRDNQILLNVNPKVSTGQVIEETGLPNEKTTEVNTNVLLRNGQGVVIGGLIQEQDIDEQSKLMFLGDLYVVGALFRRRAMTKIRKEVVFFLLPQIVPPDGICDPQEAIDHQRTQTRLFHGPLHPNYRPYDPRFPSCHDGPPYPWLEKFHNRVFQPEGECGYQYAPPGDVEMLPPGRPLRSEGYLPVPGAAGGSRDHGGNGGNGGNGDSGDSGNIGDQTLPVPSELLYDSRTGLRPRSGTGSDRSWRPDRSLRLERGREMQQRPVMVRLPSVATEMR